MFTYFKDPKPKKNVFSVAFYNLDNLFDIYDDPDTMDDDFTPQGEKRWTIRRYKSKLNKIGEVLMNIGLEHSTTPPVLIGVAEVENEMVVDDLVNSKHLQEHQYGFAHFESPDERGIDVALLYQKEHFEFINTRKFELMLMNEKGVRDYTRDILCVKGNLHGELVHIIVNHWPSRRAGIPETEPKRIQAAKKVHEIIQLIKQDTPNAKIIIMGDFNDGPNSISIKNHLVTEDFYNPMQRLKDTGYGSLTFNDKWFLFDQIIFSKNFFNLNKDSHYFKYADVFDSENLKTWKGKYKNKPFRTYLGNWHQGGYSDHFPVFAYLEKL